jgi:broad specificity phosphatase PhoE
VIIFVRHAESTMNAEGLLGGRSDPPLSALGETQARRLAPLLVDVAEVWVSPLQRARQTAALALPSLEATVNEAFVEVDYGDLEGQPFSVLVAERARTPDFGHTVAFGGAESLASVDRRVHRELDALLADTSSLLHSPSRHLAIVSHVGPIKSATVWALGVAGSTAWRTRLDNASLTTVGVRADVPQLIRFNVVSA